ncbi:MAG: mannose-1-phosphate guanylyltransferase/mannose-6-phosphate isomerase [Archaeoglobales archaeon]|nr:mannose-1-phosphate guanylyltransferase/mannose-6-phosphate isomerase [Archaeoglobales archaeon]
MKTLILAGGKGTRLWPLSREQMPKQFIRLFGESLFQKTLRRALLFSKPEEVYIVANKEYKFRILDDIEDASFKIPKENIILEPKVKNTLPAIYYGIKIIGNGKVAVLPSDHLIDVNESYLKAFKIAEELSDKYLITFGVKPTKPHTGYGYILPGKKLEEAYEVREFKEKPTEEKAREYLNLGCFWNSGMFLFDSKIFIDEVKEKAPEVAEAFESNDLEKAYEMVPEISIDYGLLERSSKVAVVPLETYWNDLGSFDSIYEVMNKNGDKNAIKGEAITLESRNNLIIASRLTALVGVEDLVVIDTDDAILISKLGETQKVKNIFKMLEERKDVRAIVHRTAYRPWGSYTVLEEGDRYKIKRITVKPGKRLSLQRHYHRSEHWVVVKGTAKIVYDGKEVLLRPGESTFIPIGVLHRIENPGKVDLEIIEIQIGEYLHEDDIERIEDDYERI